MKLWKQILLGVGIGILLSAFMFIMMFSARPKLDANGQVIQPPPQYPYVNQIKMSLTLKPDERFVSIQYTGHGSNFFWLTTEIIDVSPNPSGRKTLRVYQGLMEGPGVMINQPALFFTIKEQ